MKAMVLSGGASKGAYTAGVVKYLLQSQGMDFDLAIGTSTGSLIGGPALMGEYNYLESVYTAVHNNDVFKNSAFAQLLNLFVKGPLAASMKPLEDMVRKYYLDEGHLQDLINAGKEFVVTIVNVRTGQTVFVSTKQVKDHTIDKTTFVKAVVASCSEPIFTKPIRVFEQEPNSPMKNDLFYDGGVREFMPLEHAVSLGADEIWAVSTHPLTTEITSWGGTTDPDHVNIVKALTWTIGAALNEVERGDLFRAYVYHRQDWARTKIKEIADALAIAQAGRDRLTAVCDDMFPGHRKLAKLYVINPSAPMPTSMEFEPAVMENYFVDGKLAAEKFFQGGAPEFVDAGSWLMPDMV